MDCCLCEQSPLLFRPRNSLCSRCFEGAKEILEFSSRLDAREDDSEEDSVNDPKHPRPHSDALKSDTKRSSSRLKSSRAKGLADAVKRIKQLEQAVVTTSKQISYLNGLGDTFVEGLHTDLELVCEDGLSLKVHRVILAARSSVFRTMLEMGTVTEARDLRIQIPDIAYVELKFLVEFMYSGKLGVEVLQYHALRLIQAADKYDVPLLVEICESYLADTMSAKNALDILEVTTRLSSATTLKEAAMSTILINYESLMFCQEYEDFAMKNPLLAVKVTQYVLEQLKPRIIPKSPHAHV